MRSQLARVKSPDAALRARSFEVLTNAYYKPVYKYARVRWRKSEDDARDLTQTFFATALEKGTFAAYDPAKARFRTYLRMCLDRFVAKHDRAGKAMKRGGASATLSLDWAGLEREISADANVPGDVRDDYFDREWVRHLLGAAADGLRAECRAKGKEEHFRIFELHDLHAGASDRPSYAEIAAELGVGVTDVTNRLAYARREFRRLVLEELRELTATDEEFRSEALAVLGVRL
jgi:RNA polymerase sigma factor (sigma-70 family)